MDTKTYAKYEARAKVIKALAHPSRLLIVDELSKKSRCVCELTEMVGADTSTVSKHLTILKEAGIIRDRRQGTWIFYELRCPCILRFYECVEEVIKTNVQAQQEALA